MKRAVKKKTNKVSKPHSLAQIQKAVFSAIRTPLTDNQRSRKKLSNGASMKALAVEFMRPNDRLSEFERVEIYNRQYWFRLIDCLYDDFQGLRAILGEKKFYILVQSYLIKYPSHSYTLRNIGSKLVEFIKKQPKYCGKRAAIALDMAKFEWAQIEAFDSALFTPVDFSNLKISNPDKLKLNLQPYINLLELNYPIDDFIIAMRKEHAERSEAGSEVAPKRTGKPCAIPQKQKIYLAVHRMDNLLYYKRLEKPAYVLLSELKKGVRLGDACEIAAKVIPLKLRQPDRVAAFIQDSFTTWRNLNWFCTPPKK